MKARPNSNLVYSLRDQNMVWLSSIAELVDNTLDAGTRLVRFGWPSEYEFFIEDFGRGVKGDIPSWENMFRLGEHSPHPGQRHRSGQYGVGFKHATGWMWGDMEVTSCDGHVTGKLSMRWEEWARSGDEWELPDPIFSDTPGAPSGVRIHCRHMLRRSPDKETRENLVRELSFLFNPALRRGVRIECQYRNQPAVTFAPFAAPERTDVIEGRLEVGGKPVTVNVGLVPSHIPNPRNGLHYYRAHRLVKAGSQLGCGPTNPARVFGWVELDRAWLLSIHKNEITDPLREELGQAIEAFCRPVLDKAGREAEQLALRDIEDELSALLTERMRAKRQSPGETKTPRKPSPGTQRPGGGRHRNAAQTQKGAGLIDQAKYGGVRVFLVDLDTESQGVGLIETGSGIVIKINQRHPQVAWLIAHRSQMLFDGIHYLAVSLLAHHEASAPTKNKHGQMQWAFLRHQTVAPDMMFSVALGEFLATLKTSTGEPA